MRACIECLILSALHKAVSHCHH